MSVRSGANRRRAIGGRSRRITWPGAFAVSVQPGTEAVWAADITYIPTREGWVDLAVILDLATRRVVG